MRNKNFSCKIRQKAKGTIKLRFGEDIFLRMTADFSKLKKYGFTQKGNAYIYSNIFMQNEFKAEIKVDSKGKLTGKVIELETNEE